MTAASNDNYRTLPAGVILAGGLSRRMFASAATTGDTPSGDTPRGDKALLPLGATTMLELVIAGLRPQVAHLALNANGDPARFAAFGLPVIADTIGGFVGPLAGVLAGLRWAQQLRPQTTHILTVSADAPFLPSDLMTRLMTVAAQHPLGIAIAQSGGELHPVIGCWPVVHADDLDRALASGVRKVLRWTDGHGTHPVPFDFLDIGGRKVDPFFNANTPDELNEARQLLALKTS